MAGHASLQAWGEPVAVGFGVDFIAHFDQQGHVFARAKTSIQAKIGLNGAKIGAVLCFELLQALLKALDFCLMSQRSAVGDDAAASPVSGVASPAVPVDVPACSIAGEPWPGRCKVVRTLAFPVLRFQLREQLAPLFSELLLGLRQPGLSLFQSLLRLCALAWHFWHSAFQGANALTQQVRAPPGT